MMTWRCCVDGEKALLVRHTHTTQLCFGNGPLAMAEPGFFVGPVLRRCGQGTALKERDQITLDTLGPILKRKAPDKRVTGLRLRPVLTTARSTGSDPGDLVDQMDRAR